MITCNKNHLAARCLERGYTLQEVMPCVVSQDGDEWVVDPSHPAYPRSPKPAAQQTGPLPTYGAGSELKKLLSRIGITAKPNCSCNARAKRMDQMGVEWCRQNIDEISSWLREEATKRKLPYSDMVGKALISLAIRRAEKTMADMPDQATART